jgi:predicted nucleotidyltransferase component of viral defense system
MTDLYPLTFADIDRWHRAHKVTRQQGRRRFAQFVILCGIGSVPALREQLVFKGGNALDFVYSPNRGTIDLDFSLDMHRAGDLTRAEPLLNAVADGLANVAGTHNLTLRCHAIRQMPPGEHRTFVTYSLRIGYALPDEPRLQQQMAEGRPSPQVIPVEVSLNEPIVADARITLLPGKPPLRVSTIEDIIGEKLRAILQQPNRNRSRRQDVLDIAVAVRNGLDLDLAIVAEALLTKARARDVPVSRAAFRDPEIAERASQDYDALAATTRVLFIPFDEALGEVLRLVDTIPIPDQD